MDSLVSLAIDQLVDGKAIGIFTFLFGVGFALQMRSRAGESASAPLIAYRRRLVGLMLLGLCHWIFLWSGEILHVYAIAGLLLVGVSGWRSRTLLVVGLALAVAGRPLVGRLLAALSAAVAPGADLSMAILDERHLTFLTGSLWQIVTLQISQDVLPQVTTGATAAAVAHALGRFMVGVAVVRAGYLDDPLRYRRGYSAVVLLGLLVGGLAQRDWVIRDLLDQHGWMLSLGFRELLVHLLDSVGVTAITAAYAAAFLLGWQALPLRKLLEPFAPAGRMALTNYLLQTPLCYVLFCGFGLGLIGRVGPAGCLGLSIALYALQLAGSHWWLNRFRMGPIEWLWRWWTHGIRPKMRIV